MTLRKFTVGAKLGYLAWTSKNVRRSVLGRVAVPTLMHALLVQGSRLTSNRPLLMSRFLIVLQHLIGRASPHPCHWVFASLVHKPKLMVCAQYNKICPLRSTSTAIWIIWNTLKISNCSASYVYIKFSTSKNIHCLCFHNFYIALYVSNFLRCSRILRFCSVKHHIDFLCACL